jgi:hypothetical protein
LMTDILSAAACSTKGSMLEDQDSDLNLSFTRPGAGST